MRSPISNDLSYAKAGVTPTWRYLQVIDVETGELIPMVKEANATEGWVIRHKRDETGKRVVVDGALVEERVEIAIRIVDMRAAPPASGAGPAGVLTPEDGMRTVTR